MASARSFISSELAELHSRLLAHDPTARDAIANLLLAICPRHVSRSRPRVTAAAVHDSVEDAVLYDLEHPGWYDPTKLNLLAYIERAALRNLTDWHRSETARHIREISWASERVRVQALDNHLDRHLTPADVWPRLMKSRRRLTNSQWALVEPFIGQPSSPAGHGRTQLRPVMDGVLAIIRSGGRWHSLPRGLPSPSTCYRHFRSWSKAGVLKLALDRLERDLT